MSTKKTFENNSYLSLKLFSIEQLAMNISLRAVSPGLYWLQAAVIMVLLCCFLHLTQRQHSDMAPNGISCFRFIKNII